MRIPLLLHPDSRCEAVTGIRVHVSRGKTGDLLLHYYVTGDVSEFITRWPDMTKPARADELWRHTCFEAFVNPIGSEAYFEFNFAPSFLWAAYRFAGYRTDRRDVDLGGDPTEEAGYGGGVAFELRASLRLAGIPELAGDWRMGISTVIEERNGNISYWALKHPPGKADFHHADGFALELPAT